MNVEDQDDDSEPKGLQVEELFNMLGLPPILEIDKGVDAASTNQDPQISGASQQKPSSGERSELIRNSYIRTHLALVEMEVAMRGLDNFLLHKMKLLKDLAKGDFTLSRLARDIKSNISKMHTTMKAFQTELKVFYLHEKATTFNPVEISSLSIFLLDLEKKNKKLNDARKDFEKKIKCHQVLQKEKISLLNLYLKMYIDRMDEAIEHFKKNIKFYYQLEEARQRNYEPRLHELRPGDRDLMKKIPMTEIVKEMKEIEEKQREYQKQWWETAELLLNTDRDKGEEPSIEECRMPLFELGRRQSALFRRQAELIYTKRSQRLEERQYQIEKEIRQLMQKPESQKTEEDQRKEEELTMELIDIVDLRNSIIESTEMDRRRELEEDHSVQEQKNKRSKNKRSKNKRSKKKEKYKMDAETLKNNFETDSTEETPTEETLEETPFEETPIEEIFDLALSEICSVFNRSWPAETKDGKRSSKTIWKSLRLTEDSKNLLRSIKTWEPARQELLELLSNSSNDFRRISKWCAGIRLIACAIDIGSTVAGLFLENTDSIYAKWLLYTANLFGALGLASTLLEMKMLLAKFKRIIKLVERDQELFAPIQNFKLVSSLLNAIAETEEIKQAETEEIEQAETGEMKEGETDKIKQAETEEIKQAETEEIKQAETEEIKQAETEEIKQAEKGDNFRNRILIRDMIKFFHFSILNKWNYSPGKLRLLVPRSKMFLELNHSPFKYLISQSIKALASENLNLFSMPVLGRISLDTYSIIDAINCFWDQENSESFEMKQLEIQVAFELKVLQNLFNFDDKGETCSAENCVV